MKTEPLWSIVKMMLLAEELTLECVVMNLKVIQVKQVVPTSVT